MIKRSATVVLGGLMAVASLTACGTDPQDADYTQVCVDESNIRVEDDRCPDDDDGRGFVGLYRWFYMPSSHAAPALGSPIIPTQGSFVRPTTGKIATVSRGGFGGRTSGGGS